ncbi:serine/threonine-protein kinase [Massilia sp. erpn]|uniref:serine/threonine-protein kinase n=1 Tax=Massilia sp. erpn TaxID=2738142 RepID=UPI002107A716|nr:serine/threonine-protein kinase [Massilia sp. erpn]UTY56246.1 protein kinase [Massilia sp. erpn]
MHTVASAAPATAQDEPSLGHYQIRRCLGEGGFGQVFEAWDERLRRPVAIKYLRNAATLPPDALLREARLAASLKHRAFVRVFAIEEAAGMQYIVMELVPGKTLRQCLQENNLGRATPLSLLAAIADAMAEAHASGLVHGDLKPSNLIVEADGAPRILDFGLARHLDPLATCTSATAEPAPGTVAYMAPERLAGQPCGTAADIYALGVLLYELLAGQRPFPELHGLALAAALMQTSSRQWPLPADTDPVLLALLLDMTAPEPQRRPASMRAVQQRLAALAPAAPGAPRRFTLPARRRLARPLRHALFALLSLGLVGGTLYLGQAPLRRALPAGWFPASSEQYTLQDGMRALHSFDRDGSLDSAVQAFSAVLARTPASAGASAGLALAYCLRYSGDGRDPAWLKLAHASAQQALLQDDQLALAHAALGDVLRLEGRFDAAQASYARALQLDPGEPAALAGHSNLLLATRRFAEAATFLREVQQRWPRERRFADLYGALLFQQGDYRGAEQAFRHSLQLDPDTVFAYANLSATLLHLDRADEALRVLQQGLQIRPNGRLYSNLGNALFARGDYAGAVQAFERAVSGARGSPQDYLKWANLADALRWLPGREAASRQAYEHAVALLAPQLEREPGNGLLLSRMGLYRAHLDKPAAALAWSERALRALPANADVQFRAAVSYELAGQRLQAIASLEQARKLGYPRHLIDAEPDLIALRRDIRYQPLLSESRK